MVCSDSSAGESSQRKTVASWLLRDRITQSCVRPIIDRGGEMTKGKRPATPAERIPPDVEELLDEIAEGYLEQLQAGTSIDREAIVAAHAELVELLDRRLRLIEMIFKARPNKE